MKTQYYTLQNINQQANTFLDKLNAFREKHKNQVLLPTKAALLIIDMQNFFCTPTYHAFIPSMPAIVPNIKKMQDSFLCNNFLVMQTKHGNKPENCGQMYKWWNSFNDANDPLAAIISDLTDPRVKVIEKTQYDAFWNTSLEHDLRAKKITQIIIAGVMTHLCCETTARSAFMRGFEVFFVIDGTATYNETFHFSTLYNLAHGFALPVLTSEILAAISRI